MLKIVVVCTIILSLHMPLSSLRAVNSAVLRTLARQMSSTPPAAPPSAWLLSYKYVEGILEKRTPYREGHLGLANDLAAAGKMIAGGPLVGKRHLLSSPCLPLPLSVAISMIMMIPHTPLQPLFPLPLSIYL